MFTKDISRGLKAYGEGFRLISELKLGKYFLVPAAIGLLIGVGVFGSAYALSDNIGGYLSGWYPFDWGKSVVDGIANFLGGFIVLILGYILYKNLLMAFSAPFMSPISEKIEQHLRPNQNIKTTDSGFMELLMRGIRLSLRNLLLELLITIPLLILTLIPVIGLLGTVLIFFVQAFYCGFGNMDYTLERHKKYGDAIRFVSKNKGLAIGNGILFMLFLLVPFVGVMLTLPISAAAATVITVERLNEPVKK